MNINTTTQISNYNGQNSFILNLKGNLSRYGRLTPKQLEIANKILLDETKKGEIKVEELSEDLQLIMKYEGSNDFVLEIKEKYVTYRNLTDRQIQSAVRTIKREKAPSKVLELKLNNESVQLKRGIALKIKKEYGLEFMPILVDLVKTTMISPKAVKVVAKLTKENGDVCRCCGATLTDEKSMVTGLGPICSKNLGIPYIKDNGDITRFKMDLESRIDEIGEFEFWLPKTQIKEYVGRGRMKFITEHLYNG